VRSYGGHVYDDLFSKGDLFMYTNGHVKERLIAIGCDERKTALHRVDVDTSRFVFAPRERKTNEPVRLLTVARLVEKKGVEFSIRAVAQVLARHPDLRYDIVGAGPLREQLQGLIDELGVGAAIRLLGPKSPAEVRQLFADAHLFVLASVTAADGDKEGLPVALLEAQASGLPVVCTRHSGSPEAIVEGQSGFLVPERDAEALAERITYLIQRPEIWPALGRVGRRHIEAHFDTNMLNDRLVQLYQRVLDGASYEG
jgi:colanic acid/amylovoran biosynthesis glycosyltransferase